MYFSGAYRIIFLSLVILTSQFDSGNSQDISNYNTEENEDPFVIPPMPPRIYTKAPSGVLITQVKLNETLTEYYSKHSSRFSSHRKGRPSRKPESSCLPKYFLSQNSHTDHEQFSISLCTGTISTAKYVEESVGHVYKVIVVANDERNRTIAFKEVQIEVTPYNSMPPVLALKHYTTEVLDTSASETLVLTIIATDNDTDPVNKEFHYTLKSSEDENRNPWVYPLKKPIIVNSSTGEVRISDSLRNYPSPLRFKVLVSDSGSPIRINQSTLTLHIRNISAPRNVRIFNTTKSSVKVCWSEPLHGTSEGYIVTYNSRGSAGSFPGRDDRGTLNLTIDELETRTDDPPVHFQMMTDSDDTESEQASLDEVHEELYNFFAHQFCTTVENLQPLTNYAISVRAWAHPNKISMARLPLTVITKRKNCNDITCKHGVCQEKNAFPGYKCICRSGYYGEHCDHQDICIKGKTNLTCLNGGRCLRLGGEYKCQCLFGFIGERCEKVDPCIVPGNPCLNGGTCSTNQHGSTVCNCKPYFSGVKCEINLPGTAEFQNRKEYCEADTTETAEGIINWPRALPGVSVFLDCPFGRRDFEFELPSTVETTKTVYDTFTNDSEEIVLSRSTRSNEAIPEAEIEIHVRSTRDLHGAVRTCLKRRNGTIYWAPPLLTNCRIREAEVEDILKITSSREKLNSTLLQSSVKRITHWLSQAITNKEVAQDMVSALSNILNADSEIFEDLMDSTNTSQSILSTIYEYTSKVPLQIGEKIKLRAQNLVLEAKLVHKDDLPEEVAFNPYAKEEAEHSGASEIKRERLKNEIDQKKIWFKMPKSSLLEVTKGESLGKTDHIRFQFISFKDDRLFRKNKSNSKLLHPVIMASVAKIKVQDLDTPIRYMVPIREFDPFLVLPVCVFWDTEAHKWSRTGLQTFQNERGEIFCESDHLTSFSVLLDPVGTPVMESIKPFLSVITYIGITFSTLALIATIATFTLFSFNRDKSGLIVMNLSIALLLMNISFMASLFITTDQGGCCFIGAMLHYAVTASFAWMLIEAINMYQLLVTVFPSAEIHFMRKRVLIGWVSPLVLVIIALIWNKSVYFTEYQTICVISPLNAPAVYYTTYLAPLCIVLFINIGVFILVARVLCQSRPTYTRKVPVTLAQIRGAIAIVALLGITWLTGIFAVGHLRVVSQVLFCLTTPFQGLIIFWVRVMQSSDAKSAWKTFLKTGSTRKRPQPLSSQRTHSSSHQASSFHTQSTGASPNSKSVYESALNTVRRLSSSGLGFIGSAKKFRSSTSSDGSTKKLRKKKSSESEKQKKSLVSEVQPPTDNVNIQINITTQNMDQVCHLFRNGNLKDYNQDVYESKIKKEYLSSADNTENQPLKDLHHIFDFDFDSDEKTKRKLVDSLKGTAFQEYIYNYLNTSKLDKTCLLYDSPKKISYSTTNLSPAKMTSYLNKDEFARSLESLLPNIGNDYTKTKSQHSDSSGEDSTKKIEKGSLSSNKTSSSCQDIGRFKDSSNISYDDSVTKSASDSEIYCDFTIPTGTKIDEIKVHNRDEPEDDNQVETFTKQQNDIETERPSTHRPNHDKIPKTKTNGQLQLSRRSSSTSNLDTGEKGFLSTKYSSQTLV
ncbi:UNVERIFIED_CONTAM: hypothetical protein RMT77_000508 [Armadillidium vulgare]